MFRAEERGWGTRHGECNPLQPVSDPVIHPSTDLVDTHPVEAAPTSVRVVLPGPASVRSPQSMRSNALLDDLLKRRPGSPRPKPRRLGRSTRRGYRY